MKIYIRNSATKHRKKTGFLTRKKTRGGRAVNRRQRAVAAGRPKANKLARKRHVKNKQRRKG